MWVAPANVDEMLCPHKGKRGLSGQKLGPYVGSQSNCWTRVRQFQNSLGVFSGLLASNLLIGETLPTKLPNWWPGVVRIGHARTRSNLDLSCPSHPKFGEVRQEVGRLRKWVARVRPLA